LKVFKSLTAFSGVLGAGYLLSKNQHVHQRFFASEVQSEADDGFKEVLIDFELKEGEMGPLQVGPKDGDKVLVANYNGKLYSVGNSCSHFGAPLHWGVLFEDKVMCPFHAAAFSVVTGAPELAPALDGIPRYDIVEKAGKSYVKVKLPLEKKKTAPMVNRDPSDQRRFVIVGGGPAGLNCAETLRQSDYKGEIVVLSDDDALPYDRTLLTKALPVADSSKFGLRPESFLKGNDIDYRLKTKVNHVDNHNKSVVLSDGSTLSYDKLCIATGGSARKPSYPGIDLNGVYYVRSAEDQRLVKEHAKFASSVVVIGSSFIGSEAAASLKNQYKNKLDVYLVGKGEYPL
jgi:nitrite reductase/ring-hydroxylating ferredoxin subunit